MSKYSNEFKIKVVNAYLLGEGGAGTIANKYKVARTCVQQWVAQYKLGGKFTEPTRHFSGEFKLKVLNYQQEHHLSDLQTALIFGITNQGTNFWNHKPRNNLCMAKEVYYRWYRSSVSETRQAFKNAKEKFNTEQTKRRMDER